MKGTAPIIASRTPPLAVKNACDEGILIGEQAAMGLRKEGLCRFWLHDLRHRFAADYLRAGGNVYTLQKIMGHDSIKTTEGYLRYLTPEEQQHSKYGVAQKGAQV